MKNIFKSNINKLTYNTNNNRLLNTLQYFKFSSKNNNDVNNNNNNNTNNITTEDSHNNNNHNHNHNEDLKQATENFVNSINNTKSSRNEDIRSIETYIKNFNNKIYKQNLELTTKLQDLFNTNNTNTDTSKIFMAVNEINKVNINNTSKLLKLFLIEVIKSDKFNSDNNNNSNNSNSNNKASFSSNISSMLLISAFGFLLFNYFNNRRNSASNIAVKLIDQLQTNKEIFLFDNTLPLCLANRLSFNKITDNNDLYIMIGAKGIGKTESLKHFCKQQIDKDGIIIYTKDVNNALYKCNNDVDLFLFELLKNHMKNNNNSSLLTNFNDENAQKELVKEVIKLNVDKKLRIVIDNYTSNNDNDMNKRLVSYINKLSKDHHIKTLIVANNNSILSNIPSLDIDYSINYLESKANTSDYYYFLNDKMSKKIRNMTNSTVEELDKVNIKKIEDKLGEGNFSISFLKEYLNKNNKGINNLVNKTHNKIELDLKIMKVTDKERFDYLKALVSNNKNNNSYYVGFNSNNKFNLDFISFYEEKGWLISRDMKDYKITNSILRDLMKNM